MAYTPPTSDDFLARFPEFEGQDDLINVVLAEAAQAADNSWDDIDHKNGVMYYAAHLMAMGEQAGVGGGVGGGGVIQSETLGPISVSYANSSGSGGSSSSVLKSTLYGQQYLGLLKKNITTPPVI